jgi:WD repeat-containing protein 1 (actin-interacting protein 1)
VTKGDYSIISGRINDIAWDGDSQRIIAVGDGKQRYGHCITADSGNTVGEISGHGAQVNSVSVRQQRPLRAATAGDDKNVVFYHGAPFKFNSIPGRGTHTNFVYGVAFSPDGEQLVSVGADSKVLHYDGKTGEFEGQMEQGGSAHKGSIFGVSWASDSRKFATAGADRTVRIWDVEVGKAIQTITFGEEGIVSVPDQQVGIVWPPGRSDNLIISLSLNGDLNYLHEGSPKPAQILSGHQKNITALTIDQRADLDTPTLWTGSYDGRLCAWDSNNGISEKVDGESHTNIISGLVAPSGEHGQLYSVGWDDHLRSVDVGAKTFAGVSTHLSSQPKAVTCTSDDMVVVALLESVIVFSKGEEVGELPLGASPTSLAANGSVVAMGASNSSLSLYSVSPSKAPKRITSLEKVSASALSALSITSDGSMIVAADTAGKIFVYKINDSSLDLVTSRWSGGHTGKITCIAWNKAGTHAVSGSLDTNIFAWSLKDPGARVKVSNAHKEGVNGIAWAGGRVISCGVDATVKVWQVLDLK